MQLLILLCLYHVVWADKLDFYHTPSKVEFVGPSDLRKDSFYGFSTTYDHIQKRLIISAPRASIIGEVYGCNINTKLCTKFNTTIQVYGTYNHDYWFGATVRATSKHIVACAPRFTTSQSRTVGMHGRCYRNTAELFNHEIKPGPTPDNSNALEHDMETLGWDLDVASNDFLVVGGPGMYNKIGLAAFSQRGDKLVRMPKKGTETKVAFNFGYSVSVGYFLEEGKYTYAVGSTYGTKGPGQVYFFMYNENSLSEFETTLKKKKDAEVVGSMFGAVLCAATLANTGKKRRTGTKANDLLVGAPTYSNAYDYNAGAVYVYTFVGRKSSPDYKRTIIGKKVNSFFGSAIITVGDLNGDGVDEIAIGAPYEEKGNGAVYLYCGASLYSDKNDHELMWLQKLQPTEPYHSFGFNLAALKDYDDNGCNELAVSAPFDNKVVLYRCMAAVTITDLTAEFPNLQDRSTTSRTDFTFQVCVLVKYPVKPTVIHGDISTNVQIDHPSAKLTRPNKGSVHNFVKKLGDRLTQYCDTVGITLPLDGNYGMEITYEISTTLLDSPVNKTNFDATKVILSDISKLKRRDSVWAAECSGNKECISILSLSIKSSISKQFTIGSVDEDNLTIDVLNTGEVAYDPCVHIHIVGAVAYRPPNECDRISDIDQIFQCTSRKPLRTNKHWVIENFSVDLSGLTSKNTKILYNVTLFNSCKVQNVTSTRKSYMHDILLKSSTEKIHITGSNNYGNIVNMKQDDLLTKGKRLEHTYTISNNDVTNFVDLTCTVKLQKDNFIKYAKKPVSYYIDGTSERKQCKTVSDGTESELIAQCLITSLAKQSNVKVMASIDITPSTQVYDKVHAENVTVNSSITLNLTPEVIKQAKLSTTMVYEQAFVELWILILAGIVGLCLIIILALILYECGFLRRKNKEELEKLKTSVKRQTIRRSAMMQQQHQQTDDRLNILERMEEVDEQPVDVQQPHP